MVLLVLATCVAGFGQVSVVQQPDCTFGFSFTGAASSNDYDNRQTACTSWTFVYYNTGFSALSIELDAAPDNGGQPGTYIVWPNLASGALPLTNTVGGNITGYRYQPWVKVKLNSVTGSGSIRGTALGWRPIAGQDSSQTGVLFSESAANQVNPANGVTLVSKLQSVSVNSQPAVSTQASASVAAGGAGVIHVIDAVCFSAGSTTAPALTQTVINVRDGATGAGTVKASFVVVIPAATGQNVPPFCTPALGIIGTANTAATAEWAVLVTSVFEQVALLYHDIK